MNGTEEMLQKLQKELKITRYCSLIVGMLLLLVITGGIYAMNKMEPALTAIEKMQPAIEKIEQLDIELLNEKMEQLDIEGLNKIVENLDAAELSETLKNINDAASLLKEAKDGMREFSDSITDSFSGWFGKSANDGI